MGGGIIPPGANPQAGPRSETSFKLGSTSRAERGGSFIIESLSTPAFISYSARKGQEVHFIDCPPHSWRQRSPHRRGRASAGASAPAARLAAALRLSATA